MADHIQDQHSGHFPDDPLKAFNFYQLASYRKPLSRHVAKATQIQKTINTGVIIDGKVALK